MDVAQLEIVKLAHAKPCVGKDEHIIAQHEPAVHPRGMMDFMYALSHRLIQRGVFAALKSRAHHALLNLKEVGRKLAVTPVSLLMSPL